MRCVAAVLALVAGAAVSSAVAAAPAVAAVPTVLRTGSALHEGNSLRSPNRAYTATVTSSGRFVVRHHGRAVWSRHIGADARVGLRRGGNLVFMSGRHMVWSTRTAAAGALVLGNHGVLALRSPGGVVWSDRIGNACRGAAGKRVVVDLGAQFARLCSGATQVLTTPITSGATDLGDGTPTGTWRVQSKQRDTYLYPAAGGVYYVHFWIPYDGAYGMHDSPWQRFPYGSSRYRTDGSHGCVHFPAAAIAWMYRWIRVGTVVHIRA